MMLNDEEKNEMLKELSEVHNPAEVIDPLSLPDDTYQAKLEKIFFDKVKNGKIKLVIEFTISSGTYLNRTVRKWCNLETEQNLDFLAMDLKRLGVPADFRWADVESYFSSLLDQQCIIELATKNGFQNVYIVKRIEPETSSQVEKKSIFAPSKSTDDDDIPF